MNQRSVITRLEEQWTRLLRTLNAKPNPGQLDAARAQARIVAGTIEEIKALGAEPIQGERKP